MVGKIVFEWWAKSYLNGGQNRMKGKIWSGIQTSTSKLGQIESSCQSSMVGYQEVPGSNPGKGQGR